LTEQNTGIPVTVVVSQGSPCTSHA